MTGRPDGRDRFGVNRGAATGPHPSEEEAAVIPTESGAVPEELLAMAKAAAAPQLTAAALDRRFGPRSTWEPAAGELWRAVGEDVTALVVLLAVDATSVAVAPATVESSEPGGEADAVVLDETALGVPVTIWAGLRRTLPMAVLDRPIDVLGTDVLVRIAERAGGTASTELTTDDVRAELADDLDDLAGAEADRAAAPVPAAGAAAGIDIDTLSPEALDEAAMRLGASLPVVLDLIDGKRPPTAAEADVLREVLGAAPEAAPPPAALVVQLHQPRWRGLVRQHRDRNGLSEAAARSALAYDIGAMAARQTGDAEPAWAERIRRWAQAHQLDPDAEA